MLYRFSFRNEYRSDMQGIFPEYFTGYIQKSFDLNKETQILTGTGQGMITGN